MVLQSIRKGIKGGKERPKHGSQEQKPAAPGKWCIVINSLLKKMESTIVGNRDEQRDKDAFLLKKNNIWVNNTSI